MSARDGVKDQDYDELRKTGLTREQCFAILACIRTPMEEHDADMLEDNKRQSGVRVPGLPEPDFLQALEMIRELEARIEGMQSDDPGV